MVSRYELLSNAISNMGLTNTASYLVKTKLINSFHARRVDVQNAPRPVGVLRAKCYDSPFVFRYNSSDINVFSQVFLRNNFKVLTNMMHRADFIVDCGANVGYTTAFFLNNFKRADVVALEPDTANYSLLKQNVAQYGGRVKALHAAIWSHETKLKVCPGELFDKREWSTAVRECKPSEVADTKSYDIASILQSSGRKKIDILKMDIEGAEEIVFGANFESWVDKVHIFAIELHGKKCKDVFENALRTVGEFNFSRSGEVTIAQRKC